MNYLPLPPPDYPECFEDLDCYRDGWSADQMRAYVDADRAQRGEPVAWYRTVNGVAAGVSFNKVNPTLDGWAEFALYTAPPEPEAVALLQRIEPLVVSLLTAWKDAAKFAPSHQEPSTAEKQAAAESLSVIDAVRAFLEKQP